MIEKCNCDAIGREGWIGRSPKCKKHGNCPCLGQELFKQLNDDYKDLFGYVRYASISSRDLYIEDEKIQRRKFDYMVKKKLLISLLHTELDKNLPGVYKIV